MIMIMIINSSSLLNNDNVFIKELELQQDVSQIPSRVSREQGKERKDLNVSLQKNVKLKQKTNGEGQTLELYVCSNVFHINAKHQKVGFLQNLSLFHPVPTKIPSCFPARPACRIWKWRMPSCEPGPVCMLLQLPKCLDVPSLGNSTGPTFLKITGKQNHQHQPKGREV